MAPLPLIAVALMTSGCLQRGDYAMSAECETFTNDVREAAAATWGDGVSVEDTWAGDSAVWCSFDVMTGVDVPTDDPRRQELAATVQDLVDAKNDRGMEVTLRYAETSDIVTLDSHPSAAP